MVKDQGYLFLTTPNQSSLFGLFGLLVTGSGLASKPYDNVYEQFDRVSKMGYYGHIREFTTEEVIQTIQNFDFELIDINYFGYGGNSSLFSGQLIQYLEKYFPDRKVFAKYLFRKT